MNNKEKIEILEIKIVDLGSQIDVTKKKADKKILQSKLERLEVRLGNAKNIGKYLNTNNFNEYIHYECISEIRRVKKVTGYSKESLFLFKTHKQVVSQKFLDAWVDFTGIEESKWVTTERIKQ
jgi:hypothetical protein